MFSCCLPDRCVYCMALHPSIYLLFIFRTLCFFFVFSRIVLLVLLVLFFQWIAFLLVFTSNRLAVTCCFLAVYFIRLHIRRVLLPCNCCFLAVYQTDVCIVWNCIIPFACCLFVAPFSFSLLFSYSVSCAACVVLPRNCASLAVYFKSLGCCLLFSCWLFDIPSHS